MSDEMMVHAQHEAGLRFEIASGSGHRFLIDSDHQSGGQNAGVSPLELLLAGLAGCAGTNVISILKKQRQDVRGYAITVHGVRASKPPRVFSEITIEHVITGKQLKPAAVERAIKLTEERYCGVEAMLGKTVRIQHTIRIVECTDEARAETPTVAIF